MKKIHAKLCVILLSASAYAADTFTINGRDIIIPDPKGFVRVTDEMTSMKRLVEKMQDPLNDILAYYIPESDVPAAMAGEITRQEQYFILKVNKKISNLNVVKKDFSAFKDMTKSQNRKVFEKIKAQMPEYMLKMSQGINQEFDLDLDIGISQVVPLEYHYESENALAFSMYINYEVTDPSENEKTIISATATYLNTHGKVLFLYCYGSKNQLAWTRSASSIWAESINASNSQL